MGLKNEEIFFNRGVPAEDSLPRDEVARIVPRLLEEGDDKLLRYGNSAGYPPLREAVAERYPGATKENVLIGNGSLQILDLIASHYLDECDLVVVERPTYDRALKIFERAGLEVVGVGIGEDGLDLEELKKMIKGREPELLYTITDFQNPTGTTTSEEKRQLIAELAREEDIKVLEDSPYRELRYLGEEVSALRSYDPERVFQLSSFSKLICPGLRVGWLVGERETIKELSKYAEDTYISPNQLSQGIVKGLIEEGWFSERVDELIDLYRPRLSATLESLENFFPEASWVESEGGFFVGLWLPEPGKTGRFYKEAEERGLILSSPAGFFPEGGGEGFVRLPFPALAPARIKEGVRRMAETWQGI